MALGSTPVTEMSTRNLSGVERQTARKADNITVICELFVCKMGEPRLLRALWAFTVC
jgi:hypothetical protein